MTTDLEVPYLIVGAGPTGLLGSILLAERGMPCLVVERRGHEQRSPAAHVVNARTFEICRQAGIDMERVFAAAKDPADAGHVNFVSTLTGQLVGRLPFERQGPECLEYTPTPLRNLSQHRFEPILVDEARARGVEPRYGVQWESSEQDSDGVTSVLRDLATDTTFVVRSEYLIACDGAGSRIRKSTPIEMEGPPLLQSFVMIHFGADLRSAVGDRPGVLHFTLDPEADGVFIAHDLDSEWVFMHAYDANAETVDDYDDERCRAIISRAAGMELDVDIISTSTWFMSAQVATDMRDGRILLAGDSAHRFPPSGGLGLNSGAQDIHGLVWRLEAIRSGWADDVVLDSVATERLPVARQNAAQSIENAMNLGLLAEALGTVRDRTTAALEDALADPSKADAIAEAVEAQAIHFDLLGLQLGYIYEAGAFVDPGEPLPGLSPRDYTPSARPGARLPHAWVDDRRATSTLDLVATSQLTLFTVGDHDAWASAAAGTDVPIVQVRVGVDTASLPAWVDICELGASGALLVRPDQHVAWRARDSASRTGLPGAIAAVQGVRP